MRNKFVAFALALALVAAFAVRGDETAYAYDCSASGMLTMEASSGRTLYEKNADRRLPMASTTKIVTAITVIDNYPRLDDEIVIPDEAVGVEGSSIYLKSGETLTVRDLLYGLMLRSGNDCAVALAIATARSVEKFAALMNDTARKAGANDSNFVNPHGLHDDEHYTTARDLARIAAYAMKNETFRQIVSSKRYVTSGAGGGTARVLINKNRLLSGFSGCDGIKTGYTKKAGRCLVSSATRDGMTVIAVVLNCGPMFEECAALMERAFDEYELVDVGTLCPNIEASVSGAKRDEVGLKPEREMFYPLTANEKNELKFEAIGVKDMRGGAKKGEENGKICVTLAKRLLFEAKLVTIEEVEPLSLSDILYSLLENRSA